MAGFQRLSSEEIARAKTILRRFEHNPEPPALTNEEQELLFRNGARLTAEFEQAGLLNAMPKALRDLFAPCVKA